MRYEFREGSRVRGVDAEAAGRELERIRRHSDGRLEPEAVVATAAHTDSPLHPAFEWDDEMAAVEHRLNQARNLIRSIRIVDPTTGDEKPQFVYVKLGPSEGYYQSSAVIVRSLSEWQHAVEAAIGKLDGAVHAVEDLFKLVRGEPRARTVKAVLDKLSDVRAATEDWTKEDDGK